MIFKKNNALIENNGEQAQEGRGWGSERRSGSCLAHICLQLRAAQVKFVPHFPETNKARLLSP